MSKESVLVLGARSDIGKAIAHKFASLGHPIQLAARNADNLKAYKADLELRYTVPVTLHNFDVLSIDEHFDFLNSLPALPGIAVCAVGLLGQQQISEQEIQTAINVVRSNYEGPASIFAELANRFIDRGSGTLVGISSVAGERGRMANYVYGSAKAGFTAFLSGLRCRLAKQGLHVITVLPGFVETKMTEGMSLPVWLTASPSEVANAIERAVRKNQDVVYVRPVWRLIMTVIRSIPEQVFKRMSI